jgi:predicted component of type VI protein secretion system
MPFKKGSSGNSAGRPKGSQNRAGGKLREVISDFLENRFEDVVNDFEQLEPKDRIKVYTDLLQYGVPKLQAVSNSIEFENMTDEQLDAIFEKLLKSTSNEN